MINFGAIAITRQLSVIEARNKVRALVDALSGSTMLATRISTATSEIARTLLREGDTPRIELTLEGDAIRSRLCFTLVDVNPLPELHRIAVFFDEIGPVRRNGIEHAVGAVLQLPNCADLKPNEIARLKALIQQKSRDELVAEVQAKNAELRASLEDLRRTRSAKERMESELNIGREIQMSMLPLEFPAFPDRSDFDVHAALHPAREVGGDFYDMFLVDDNHFCFSIGDVSGKGVPAALFMAVCKTLIKSRAANDLSPASVLSHVNSELSHRNESCMFVTVFLAILDLGTGDLAYSNAGHNPPYLKRPSGELVRMDQRHGPIIGAAEGLAYKQDHLNLSTGDLLFLYTDGVTEAMDIRNQLYSDDRLEGLLASQEFSSAEQSVQAGVDDVWAFQGDAEQADDITVLSLLFSGRTEAVESHRLELKIFNRVDEIEQVNAAFNAFAGRHDLGAKTRRALNMAFDELLNNTIAYGYESGGEHIIELTISVSRGRLYASISDDGKPFNPFEGGSPDTGLSVEDRPIGGLGLHLVRNMMDRVAYERRGAYNVVLLEKKLDSNEE